MSSFSFTPSLIASKAISSAAIRVSDEKLTFISSEIWSNPELGYEEFYAHQILTDFLETEQFTTLNKSYILSTGFKATHIHPQNSIEDEGIIKVAVISEYDALPELGHACGHNLIAIAGLATAIGLKAAIDADPKLKIHLTLLGTPAEEGGGGKLHFVDAGEFSSIDFAMMVHPAPYNVLYTKALSGQHMTVTYNGYSSHSAVAPWEGVNALDAAVSAYTAISNLRQQLAPDHLVHGIITEGGSNPYTIPELSVLCYQIRAPDDEQLKALQETVCKCFQAGAKATNCTVNIKPQNIHYTNLKNNSVLLEVFRDNAQNEGLTFLSRQEESRVSCSISTDMGNVSQVLPSIHPCYHISEHSNHTHEFNIDAKKKFAHVNTIRAACAMAGVAIDVANDKELLKRIKMEFNC